MNEVNADRDAMLVEIKNQMETASVSDLFGTKKEVKELPEIMNPFEETIKYAASGFVDGNTVLIVCTDKRILFVDKGLVYGVTTTEIPLDMVNGVSYSKGLVLGSVSVTNGANTTKIENVAKVPAQILADTIKTEAASFKQRSASTTSAAGNTNNLSELRELKQLMDEGIITQEEFDLKKKQILGI